MDVATKMLLLVLAIYMLFNLYTSALMMHEFADKQKRHLEFATSIAAVSINGAMIIGSVIILTSLRNMV